MLHSIQLFSKKFCVKFILCLLLSFNSNSSIIFSQIPDLDWVLNYGNDSTDYANHIIIDNSENIIIAGGFKGTIDLDPGPDSVKFTASFDPFYTTYISKFSPNGILLKAGVINFTLYKMSLDKNNNLYLVGEGSTNTDFNPDTATIDTGYTIGNFIVKLDSMLNFQWVKRIGFADAFLLNIDSSANLFIGGRLNADSINIDLADTIDFPLYGEETAFFLKVDSSGNFKWARHFRSLNPGIISGTNISSIDFESTGNLILTGTFIDSVDFDPDSTSEYFLNDNNTAFGAFLLKLNPDGNFIWVLKIGDGGTADCENVKLDNSGNIYIVGIFLSRTDFNPDPIDTFYVTAAGLYDTYILKLDSAGQFIFVKQIKGNDAVTPNDFLLDSINNIYVLGNFNTSTDFNPDTPFPFVIVPQGDKDGFICKLDSNGNFIDARSIGSIRADIMSDAYIDSNGKLYIVGSFSDGCDLDPNPLNILSTPSNGKIDSYLMKLGTFNTSIHEVGTKIKQQLYPNPTTKEFAINTSEKISAIYDSNGRLAEIINSKKNNESINIEKYKKGIYLIKIISESKVYFEKLIIQ